MLGKANALKWSKLQLPQSNSTMELFQISTLSHSPCFWTLTLSSHLPQLWMCATCYIPAAEMAPCHVEIYIITMPGWLLFKKNLMFIVSPKMQFLPQVCDVMFPVCGCFLTHCQLFWDVFCFVTCEFVVCHLFLLTRPVPSRICVCVVRCLPWSGDVHELVF